jgi:hypothetical protein
MKKDAFHLCLIVYALEIMGSVCLTLTMILPFHNTYPLEISKADIANLHNKDSSTNWLS